LKFSPSQTRITVRVEALDKRARVSVEDQGPGLTEEDRKKLFGRFSRLSAKPTGGEKSTGLGLSIVKHMVEAMDGRIWVDSEPGHGAAFRVDLPAGPP
jgi:signal transduction histidine kinase